MSKILESHPHVLRGETERPLYGLPPPPRVWHGGNYDYDGGKKAGHEPQLVSRGPHVGPSHNMIEAIAQPNDEENRFSTPEGNYLFFVGSKVTRLNTKKSRVS